MALDLMLAMAIVYPDEHKRQEKLESIFVQNGFSFSKVETSAFQCDLAIKGSINHNVIVNIEMKVELGLDGKNPNLQNIAYYITKDQRQERHQPRYPMLLISICGSVAVITFRFSVQPGMEELCASTH